MSLREIAFKKSRGRTKQTHVNETDNEQGLQIDALHGSPGNLYPFHIQTTDKDT